METLRSEERTSDTPSVEGPLLSACVVLSLDGVPNRERLTPRLWEVDLLELIT